ncbi:velvet factor-domain-containing protein [Aspergillus pseudotamarii]|uniref:Velvet factor-domain-containing protein n=1 Tax=Aspergillus pseudotamarii TaxID=132259 RepID=A0A5N6SVZ1_ASPPS|nr:velvet factor-domain-containing protein [Aspergillus pseudotamarii]KAE8138856.1 velvet factor-domain-containing protein [Aspergillus pseudotamarii]
MSSPGSDFELIIRQQPTRGRVAGAREKDRRPVDPQPIVQLRVREEGSYLAQHYLQSPYYFMCCSLLDPLNDIPVPVPPSTTLTGTLVSSLHRLKDQGNSDAGFFVFGDLSVKVEGYFRLKFTLFEMGKGIVTHLKSIMSDCFTVYRPKNFPGMADSTCLSRSFVDQGVKLRLRKKPRAWVKRSASRPGDYPQSVPPHSPDYPSKQISGNTFRHSSTSMTTMGQDFSYYTGPGKRECIALEFNNRSIFTDGRMCQIEARPQTAALHANQPRVYTTPLREGGPTGHTGVPDYATPYGIPSMGQDC